MAVAVDTAAQALSDGHRKELHASALTDKTIADAGIYSAQNGDVRGVLGWTSKTTDPENGKRTKVDWRGAIIFPFRDADGNGINYARVKLDFPRYRDDGDVIKYEAPLKEGNRAYFPPNFREHFNTGGVVIVTEGEKKCLAVAQLGHPCIGLSGVWAWQQKRQRSDSGKAFGKRKLLPEIDALEWKGRRVVIIFDSDAATNSAVQLAESRLAEVLTDKGADVRIVRLPQGGDGKTGVDDFLMHHGDAGPDELRKLLASAQPAEVPETPTDMEWATMFVEEHFSHKSGRTLQWWQDEYWRWTGTSYTRPPASELAAIVLQWLDQRKKDAKARHATEVVKALAAVCRVPYTVEQPTFLEEAPASAKNVIAFKNGLLDIGNIGGDLSMYDQTPNWFSPNAVEYAFDANAQCPRWLEFLQQTIEDGDAIKLLQEYVGLLLTSDTSYQNLLLMVGPKRSGKGTVMRAIQQVVGSANCGAPTLASLASNFGLWPLIDKTVVMFPDAHMSGRTDGTRVLEIIKAVSGEDALDIHRKCLTTLSNVRLRCRFIITVNELPRFQDTSLALEARLLLLRFTQSFVGREDRTLEAVLTAETPGIFNWALKGLYHLRQRGHFELPESSADLLGEYRRITSPVTAFLADWCDVDPANECPCDDLYAAWCVWLELDGRRRTNKATFGESLRAAGQGIRRVRLGGSDCRVYTYKGVALAKCGHDAITTAEAEKAAARPSASQGQTSAGC